MVGTLLAQYADLLHWTNTMKPIWKYDEAGEAITETAWERSMQMAGLERYEASKIRVNKGQGEDKLEAASEGVVGQKILRKLLDDAEEAIKVTQKDIICSHMNRDNKATILLISADTAALLTLKILIDATFTASGTLEGANYQVLCSRVSKAIESELNFRHWLSSSKEASALYAKEHGLKGTPESLAERLLKEHGCDRKMMWRWKQTFEELSEYAWTKEQRHFCGDVLVHAVVTALPGTFSEVVTAKGVQKVKTVVLTDETRERMTSMEDNIARLQVVKKPMLARPNQWKISA